MRYIRMKVVVLDRDGVINQEFPSQYIINEEQFIPIHNSLEAIVRLKREGYKVVVATNQSIISKRIITLEKLQNIHNKLQNLLAKYNVQIDEFFVCPHQEIDNCMCRKPKPQLLFQISRKYQFDFKAAKVHFVGDSITDLLAAQSAGAIPILVKTGKGLKTMNEKCIHNIKNLLIFNDLYDFVSYLLNKQILF